ncbi:uncharacterized protein KZ484_022196 [Pholidichthys leucotaenia]
MSRGQTWSIEEIQALVDIWSDDRISQRLVATHKNIEVFKTFSDMMMARGFIRSAEQCRIKVKKLRQQYIKVRDSLRKGGSSGEEREKFIWYDELDRILATRPTSRAKLVVEFTQEESPRTSTPGPDTSVCSSGDRSKCEGQQDEEESITSSWSPRPEPETTTSQWAIPGAHTRKRMAEKFDIFLENYMQHKRWMDEAEQKRHDEEQKQQAEERAAFLNFMRMQQEAEERRFKAMEEQQRVNNQMFMQMMGTLTRALLPQSHK